MNESKKRSITKAITWRILATVTTMALVFLFTGEWVLTVGVGLLDMLIKLLAYYVHERAWLRVRWGRK
jgi:adenylylsulfate kinase